MLGKAIASFAHTFQMWLSKFASGHSAVATTMFRWKKWDSDQCPLCHAGTETTSHILLCRHLTRAATWTQQLTQLALWMTQSNTAPIIQSCLLSTLTHCDHQTFETLAAPLCVMAAQDQDKIGLFGLMTGRLSSKWLSLQAAHYSATGSAGSGALWMVRLCHQLILVTHTLWLSRNEQVQAIRHQQDLVSTRTTIHAQFQQGIRDLLPSDYFYVIPGPEGFTLCQVLDLPLDDQKLWLHAVQNARVRGHNTTLA